MKTTREIWSLPLVLVTALLLVGLFGASVLAQVPEIEVTDNWEADGREIVIGDSDVSVAPPVDVAEAFTHEDDQATLVYTALTSNPKVGRVGLTAVTGTTGVVQVWWDALGGADNTDCDSKEDRLGFDQAEEDDDGNLIHVPQVLEDTDADPDIAQSDATGWCDNFGELLAGLLGEDSTIEQAQQRIRIAFHWDMLSDPEMEIAADAAGEQKPAEYKKNFGKLTPTQQRKVASWFEPETGILAMDGGELTLTNDGIDTDATDSENPDKPGPNSPDGEPGEATIYLKVSDDDGRLVPVSGGRDRTVGQSFTLTASLTPTGTISPFTVDNGAVTGGSTIVVPDENDLNAVAGNALANPPTSDRVDLKIGPDMDLVATVSATTVITNLDLHHQKLNFSLTDGGTLPFQIKNTGLRTAEIRMRAGANLSSGQPYNFTLTVNEFGNAPANTEEIDIRVEVVIDNVAPVFDAIAPTTGTVVERAKDATIATFSATDSNNQVLEYTIRPKARDEAAKEIFDDDLLVLGTFTGVLKTSKTQGINFVEPKAEDDPDTEDVDETDPDNEHAFIVTVSDGTRSDTLEFTLSVTDADDPAIGSDQKLTVKENNPGGVDASFGDAPDDIGSSGDAYSVGQQIDNKGNITIDEEDILFGVDEVSGAIYLRLDDDEKPFPVDFESGVVTYTLSIKRGDDSGIIVIQIADVNEGPKFSEDDHDRYDLENESELDDEIVLYVLESDAPEAIVKIGKDAGGNPSTVNAVFPATDEDTKSEFQGTAFDLWYDADTTDDDDGFNDAYAGADALFTVDGNGAVKVNTELDTDADDSLSSISLMLRTYDTTEVIPEPVDEDDDRSAELRRVLKDALPIRVEIIDTNVAPEFDEPSREKTHATVSEGAAVGTTVHTYRATDEDGDVVEYRLRDQDDAPFFTVNEIMVANATTGVMEPIGELNTAAGLDYETQTSHTVEIQAYDTDGDTDEIVITIDVTNANDNSPVFGAIPADPIRVSENSPRGTSLGSFAATDADGDDVTYSLSGANAKSFHIDGYGELKTLESLDFDSNTPCSVGGCAITVVASDANAASGAPTSAHTGPAEAARTIMVLPIEDSVSTLSVTKANPVPGTTMGDAMTALGNTKTSMSADVPERPADLPNAYGAPMNFVDTDWANWGTVLRIEVTAQSPDANCGSGNECVIISLNSDSADDTLKLQAYRMDTPAGAASNENKFVAAVMLVELDGDATDEKDSSKNDIPVYAHGDGSVARLQVDEEDEIEIELYNLRGDVEVENEAPEISNFAPEHESAFDDPDVEYTFTVVDSHSGLPEPEDLPDVDGDDAYMPAVALISKKQCETADSDASAASKARRAKLISDGFSIVEDMAGISDDGMLYCPGVAQDGEYDASGAGYGFAPIRDDKDFDDIDDGFDVETTIVLRENRIFYVTFVACDNAGNCSFFDPDGNDEGEELAEITVDTEVPVFVEARTGLTWDSTDNEYDDDRSFIQVIFNDLTKLNTETVEIADFVVEGHSIKDVHVFENPDSDDVDWGDSGRYGAAGHPNKRNIDRYRDIENVVFIELEDELLADETPDVTIVPNGVEDKAGNEQDDGDNEAEDWISPAFTIVSIVSTRVTSQDQILAGDDDEVTVVATSDERLDSTRPTVTVTYVNAPAGSIDTKGTATCDTDDGDDKGTRERGEIANSEDCADNGAATGGTLNNSVERISNTEWIVTITEPKDTGYYNFHISGDDRSSQKNPGSEGVSPGSIVTDFFDADGDVNVDDAIFFEGDINLPKPQVRVSGVSVEDNEADVEFRSPLFVELDFAANHSDNCRNVDNDERMANCMNENSEYAEDNFDDIVVTSFVLDGVDLTDSVKTTDNQSFLVSLESISIGDHTAEVQAVDQAGNVFEDTLEIDFEVNDRDPFEKRLSPGWNLVSLPGEPADSSIAAVFGSGVEVRTVYSYDPVIPGGWMVAVRETLDSDWQGDLTEITGQHGYWVLSDAIQDWEVSIPRLAGGASGTGTPIQPPVIPMYAGWNLIPVTDVSGNALGTSRSVSAEVYLNSLDDGLDLARVLGYDTIRNEWFTVLDAQMGSPGNLSISSGYWVFVREAAALVPGGVASTGGSD